MGYLAQAGYNFVVIDTEHTPWHGLESCDTAVMAAEDVGIVSSIEISGPFEPTPVTKALGIGTDGMWVPNVNTKEDVEKVVAAAKYKLPGWEYGAFGVSADFRADGYGAYRGSELREKWQRSSNEETMVTVLPLESLEGTKNIEEIISVPGLDMIDLSVGVNPRCFGYPGRPLYPAVMKV